MFSSFASVSNITSAISNGINNVAGQAMEQALAYKDKLKGTIFTNKNNIFPDFPYIFLSDLSFRSRWSVQTSGEVVSNRQELTQTIVYLPDEFTISFNVYDIQMLQSKPSELINDVALPFQSIGSLLPNGLSNSAISKINQIKSIIYSGEALAGQAEGVVNMLSNLTKTNPNSIMPTRKMKAIIDSMKGMLVDVIIENQLKKDLLIIDCETSQDENLPNQKQFTLSLQKQTFADNKPTFAPDVVFKYADKKNFGTAGANILNNDEETALKTSVAYGLLFGKR